jgi:hypothetical protein
MNKGILAARTAKSRSRWQKRAKSRQRYRTEVCDTGDTRPHFVRVKIDLSYVDGLHFFHVAKL